MTCLQENSCSSSQISSEEFAERLKGRLDDFTAAWRKLRRDSPEDFPDRMTERDWLEFLLVADILPGPSHIQPLPDPDWSAARAA